jgi:hypothetical protein
VSAPSVVHSRADWKGKVGRHVALCQKWAMTPSFGVTSEDKTKVNCTRCAKALGITPAPRVASSTAGTCQCCFNAQETRQRAGKGPWRLVLHGYTRPGCGWIQGECRGVGFEPFEVSCERTKVFLGEHRVALALKQEHLDELLAGKVPTLTASVNTHKRIPDTRPRHGGLFVSEYVSVEVPLGQAQMQSPYKSYESVPSYDDLREREVRKTESTIAEIKSGIEFLTQKIAEWKPTPFPAKR